MLRLIIALLLVIGVEDAIAGPAGARVVLADPDPELRRAMTAALRPWKLEVIADPAPLDEASAPARAAALGARFVVWRRGKELVVFDRERGDVQQRDVPVGALDPVDAASAALTVKTLMRLPPPNAPEDDTGPLAPRPDSGSEIRVQAGGAMRIAHGSEDAVGGRFVGAALLRPRPTTGWRFGLLGDLGTSDTVSRGGFDGRWSDWSLIAITSWTHAIERIEIEPFVAAGVTRSRFRGTDTSMGTSSIELDDRDTLPAIRAGAWVRYRIGMWTIGASLSGDAVPGTPTYTRPTSGQQLYAVPSIGLTVGAVVAADLGRSRANPL